MGSGASTLKKDMTEVGIKDEAYVLESAPRGQGVLSASGLGFSDARVVQRDGVAKGYRSLEWVLIRLRFLSMLLPLHSTTRAGLASRVLREVGQMMLPGKRVILLWPSRQCTGIRHRWDTV